MFRQSNGTVARIGRYDWDITSPLFGKFYVDVQGLMGSENDGVPESFRTRAYAIAWLEKRGFKPSR